MAESHASELAVRYSQRDARAVVGFLLLGGLLWYLGYALVLGAPRSAIPPPGPAHELFLLATTAIQYLPWLGVLGAIVHLVASKRLDLSTGAGRGVVARAGARLSITALFVQLITMGTILCTGGPSLWTPARTALTLLLVVAQTCAFATSVMLAARLRQARRRLRPEHAQPE